MLQGAALSEAVGTKLHQLLTWMAQPSNSWPAAITAGVLVAVGTLAYSRSGPASRLQRIPATQPSGVRLQLELQESAMPL